MTTQNNKAPLVFPTFGIDIVTSVINIDAARSLKLTKQKKRFRKIIEVNIHERESHHDWGPKGFIHYRCHDSVELSASFIKKTSMPFNALAKKTSPLYLTYSYNEVYGSLHDNTFAEVFFDGCGNYAAFIKDSATNNTDEYPVNYLFASDNGEKPSDAYRGWVESLRTLHIDFFDVPIYSHVSPLVPF